MASIDRRGCKWENRDVRMGIDIRGAKQQSITSERTRLGAFPRALSGEEIHWRCLQMQSAANSMESWLYIQKLVAVERLTNRHESDAKETY